MAEVYALEHPDTGHTMYIGCTAGRARERYASHLSPRAMPRMRRWVTLLRAQGKLPRLVVLAVTSLGRARALEAHLIGNDTALLNTRLANSAHHSDTDRIPDFHELTERDDCTSIIDRDW